MNQRPQPSSDGWLRPGATCCWSLSTPSFVPPIGVAGNLDQELSGAGQGSCCIQALTVHRPLDFGTPLYDVVGRHGVGPKAAFAGSGNTPPQRRPQARQLQSGSRESPQQRQPPSTTSPLSACASTSGVGWPKRSGTMAIEAHSGQRSGADIAPCPEGAFRKFGTLEGVERVVGVNARRSVVAMTHPFLDRSERSP